MLHKHLFNKIPKAKYFDFAQRLLLQMLLWQPEFSVHISMIS